MEKKDKPTKRAVGPRVGVRRKRGVQAFEETSKDSPSEMPTKRGRKFSLSSLVSRVFPLSLVSPNQKFMNTDSTL